MAAETRTDRSSASRLERVGGRWQCGYVGEVDRCPRDNDVLNAPRTLLSL